MNRRFRASYKIAIGFVVLVVLMLYGPRYVNDLRLGGHLPPLVPGIVNIVGLDTRAGYGILIENRTAKLVFAGKDSFQPGKMDANALESSGGEKQFIPIKEMLMGLAGDIPRLSYFVAKLNKINDEEQTPNAVVWKVEDLEKAINGDKSLLERLVHDLNCTLDGTPLDSVSKSALYNGILVDLPVPLQMKNGEQTTTVVARVKRSYKVSLLKTVEMAILGKFVDQQMIATQYAAAVQDIRSGKVAKEDVKSSLMRFKKESASLSGFPQKILDSITTVINEGQITRATYTTVQTAKGERYKLVISLSEEGKKRLWQFTRDRTGEQLLITVNGVAISAPFIEHAIASDEFEVTGLEDESLVKDAVATINNKRATKN